MNDPFGHWVFEVAVFLPLFHILKSKYPTLKLLSFNPKRYNDIFYKGFGIIDEDIVSCLPTENTVIFTEWNSYTYSKKIPLSNLLERK